MISDNNGQHGIKNDLSSQIWKNYHEEVRREKQLGFKAATAAVEGQMGDELSCQMIKQGLICNTKCVALHSLDLGHPKLVIVARKTFQN